eukprot:2249454-Pyramimonas_sp.AAC.1
MFATHCFQAVLVLVILVRDTLGAPTDARQAALSWAQHQAARIANHGVVAQLENIDQSNLRLHTCATAVVSDLDDIPRELHFVELFLAHQALHKC